MWFENQLIFKIDCLNLAIIYFLDFLKKNECETFKCRGTIKIMYSIQLCTHFWKAFFTYAIQLFYLWSGKATLQYACVVSEVSWTRPL